jgi:hypothetical protein
MAARFAESLSRTFCWMSRCREGDSQAEHMVEEYFDASIFVVLIITRCRYYPSSRPTGEATTDNRDSANQTGIRA